MIQVKVRNIGLDSITGSPIVMLANIENEDEIYPIWIGVSEAEGIIISQSGLETPRPLTYDLMKNVVEALGGVVKYVEIPEKRENTYIADVVIEKDGEEVRVDARPSDAINLALRFNAPIYIEESVFQKLSLKELLEASKQVENSPETAGQEVQGQVETKTEKQQDIDRELEEFRKLLENAKPEDFAIKPEDKEKEN
ncbi:MAG: bifunctional nuclease family protein [Aquificae bacterium]|nr:bifunctional nuclease family protein [Aquificota bacterium]